VSYVHADGMNTPRVVANASGSTVWQLPYQANPFSEQQPSSANGFVYNPRFAGQYYDAESGLIHNGFRDYCPECGRYIQSDPTGLWGGINTYAALNSSPLKYIDPMGLDAILMVNPISARLPGGSYGGHAAVAIGNDNTGWNFYSEGGVDDNGNQIITTQNFATLADLEDAFGSVYTSQEGEHTQPLQDILMNTWARKHLKDPYSATSNNCGDFVMGALRAGGLHPTANRIGPTIPNNMSIGDGPNDPNRFSPLEPTPVPLPYRPGPSTPTDSSPYTLGNPHTY
jgi:RHS repeat-associated protein